MLPVSGCLRRQSMFASSRISSWNASSQTILPITPVGSNRQQRWQSNAKSSKGKVGVPKKGAPASPKTVAPTKENKYAAPQTSNSGRAGASASSKSSAPSKAAEVEQSQSSRAGGGIDGDVIMNVRELGKILPGGRVLFKDVSLAFQRGAKIGVLGLNGAGKSSLLKILGGVDTEFDGKVWRADGIKVGYLAQEPKLDESKSVHDNIMDGLKEKTDLLARYEELSAKMAEPDADFDTLMADQATVQAEIERLDCWNLSHVVTMAKEALRVPPDNADVKGLSGGEKRRVALCRLLLEQPGVLLLDEPTNHLDATSVAWLERFLQTYKGTVLAVTHDRYFLDNVAGWILEIDRGVAYPYQGNYSVWLAKKASRLDQEKKTDRKRAKAMQDELDWIRGGVKGRQTKAKARIQRFEAMQATVDENKAKEKFLSGQIVIPPGPRLGDRVLDVKGVSKTIEGRCLFKDVNFSIPKGAIVGVIGANGTGKTTLLRVVTGEIPADEGSVFMGSTVVPGLVSQSRMELHPDSRVLEAVCGHTDTIAFGDFEMPARQYLAAFNLVGELQTKLVRSLSGGERNRVHLARVLKQGSNFLMLDEPTNDLDVDTLRSLEEALLDFEGVSLIVSHDRYFLDRLCTHMIVFHGDSRVEWFEGSYSEYEQYALNNYAAVVARGMKMYVLPGSGDGHGADGGGAPGTDMAPNLKILQ